MRVETRRRAGVERGRYVDRHQQIDVAGIAVIGDLPDLEPLRHRPFDRARRKTRPARPSRSRSAGRHRRGCSSRRASPARRQMHVDPQRAAGGDRCCLGESDAFTSSLASGGAAMPTCAKAQTERPTSDTETRQRNPLCNRAGCHAGVSLTDNSGTPRTDAVAIS